MHRKLENQMANVGGGKEWDKHDRVIADVLQNEEFLYKNIWDMTCDTKIKNEYEK